MPLAHLLLVVLICLAWGGNFLTSAYALQQIPPFLFTALRLAVVLVALAPWLRPVPRDQWPRLAAVGLLTGSMHFALNFWALREAGAISSIAILLQCYIPMSAILAWFLLGERFGWRTALGIGISFGGVLVLGFDPLVLDAPKALVLALVAALTLALGTTLMRGLKGVGTFEPRPGAPPSGSRCCCRSRGGWRDRSGKGWPTPTSGPGVASSMPA